MGIRIKSLRMPDQKLTRRGFIAGASTFAVSAAAIPLLPPLRPTKFTVQQAGGAPGALFELLPTGQALDLAPAQWIWYPAKRILPNTFFHFRKAFDANQSIKSA